MNAVHVLSARPLEKLKELFAGRKQGGWAALGPNNTACRGEECSVRHWSTGTQFIFLGRVGQEAMVGQAKEDHVRNSEMV